MKTTMTPSSRCLNVNCEMVEAFEAVLPQSILAKLELLVLPYAVRTVDTPSVYRALKLFQMTYIMVR